ncbi:hypothetical protein AB0X56_08130 [Weissella paramesenteroides]|uniref:hypothetical protein n=1 Tax=Weissella paramesenteroides TaxID=1249 RepID=UPI003F1F7D90
MSESKLNLVASTLTNSLGTTIIGHVTAENVVITVKYANNEVDTTTSDEKGSFVVKIPTENTDNEVTLTAMFPDQSAKEVVSLVIDQPAPVVTAVISTQNGQRLLEGRVNQRDVSISVHFIGDEHVISLPIDNGLEFELVLPDDILPSQIEVHATNQQTGKTGRTVVGLGVTSKTVAMPALTDEMIAEYVHNEEAKHQSEVGASKKLATSTQIATSPVSESDKNVSDAVEETGEIVETTAHSEAKDSENNDRSVTESRVERRKRGGIRGFFARLFGRKD